MFLGALVLIAPLVTSAETTINPYITGNHVKLEWSVDIEPEDVLLKHGFEDSDTPVSLMYTSVSNNGMQSIVPDIVYSGAKALKIGRTVDGGGNIVELPYTPIGTSSELLFKTPFMIPPGTNLSVNVRAKSDTAKSTIMLSSRGLLATPRWGLAEYFNTVYGTNVVFNYAQNVYAGQDYFYVTDIEAWTKYVGDRLYVIQHDNATFPYVVSPIKSVDNTTGRITLHYPFRETVLAGTPVMMHTNSSPAHFSPRELIDDNQWHNYSINTTVDDGSRMDLSGGITFNNITTSYGNTYLDDITFGYASKSGVYRDGSLVYDGYLSDFVDVTATDKTAPSQPVAPTIKLVGSKVQVSYEPSVDYGTNYEYQLRTESYTSKRKTESKKVELTNTSGVKGYSFVVDNKPDTVPDNVIETVNRVLEKSVVDNDIMYFHVVTVDNEGNVSTPVHMAFQDATAPSLVLTASKTQPDFVNDSISIQALGTDSETFVKTVESPNGNVTSGSMLNYVVTENGSYTFKVVDLAGNETSKTIVVDNIDKLKPTVTLVSDKVDSTSKGYRVNLLVSDNLSGVSEIKLKTSTNPVWETVLGNFFEVLDNGTYTVMVTDKAGNIASKTLNVSNLSSGKTTVPVLTPSTLERTVNDVTVSIDYGIDAVSKEYSLDGVSWNQYTKPLVINSNIEIQARYKTASGVYSEIGTLVVSNIVKTLPSAPLIKVSNTAPTKDDVVITINKDSLTEKVEVQIDKGVWFEYTSPIPLSSNGVVRARALGDGGGVSKEGMVRVSNIDKTPPSFVVTGVRDKGYYSGLLSPKVIVSDVSRTNTSYSVNGKPYYIGVPLDKGTYRLDVKVTDMVGNSSVESLNFNIK